MRSEPGLLSTQPKNVQESTDLHGPWVPDPMQLARGMPQSSIVDTPAAELVSNVSILFLPARSRAKKSAGKENSVHAPAVRIQLPRFAGSCAAGRSVHCRLSAESLALVCWVDGQSLARLSTRLRGANTDALELRRAGKYTKIDAVQITNRTPLDENKLK